MLTWFLLKMNKDKNEYSVILITSKDKHDEKKYQQYFSFSYHVNIMEMLSLMEWKAKWDGIVNKKKIFIFYHHILKKLVLHSIFTFSSSLYFLLFLNISFENEKQEKKKKKRRKKIQSDFPFQWFSFFISSIFLLSFSFVLNHSTSWWIHIFNVIYLNLETNE